MIKKVLKSIKQKNLIITNILAAMESKDHFLLLGHQNPDEDCISSLVAFALILTKFSKDTRIYLGSNIHEHFQYLLNICKYNSILLLNSSSSLEDPIDTMVVCDTPKQSMIEANPEIDSLLLRKDVLIIEIDHHLGADSEYIGDEGYCLVAEASSSCELVGHLALKLQERKDLLQRYQIADLFSRNLVLSLLTGIVGDSKMGQFLKSSREKRYYQIFSTMFNDLLAEKTVKKSNFSNMEEVFQEIKRLSEKEEKCFNYFMQKKRFSSSIGYVALAEEDMEPLYVECDAGTIVSVARAIADTLAEESSKLSLVAYYDNPENSDLIQFRIRRSQHYKTFDVRDLLTLFSIENGGGHEGAIGFRIPRNQVDNLNTYIEYLIQGIESAVAE